MRDIRARHPRFARGGDRRRARSPPCYRGERHEFRSRVDAALQVLRLLLVSDAFLAQAALPREGAAAGARRPGAAADRHRLAIVVAQVSIGDPVVVQPGLYMLHGQVVIDGITEVGPRRAIAPFVTIGLRAGDVVGPTIGADVQIGTGAKVIGRIEIGEGATDRRERGGGRRRRPGATVAGAPARPLGDA